MSTSRSAAREAEAEASLEEFVRRFAADFPPLTPEQRAKIAVLLEFPANPTAAGAPARRHPDRAA